MILDWRLHRGVVGSVDDCAVLQVEKTVTWLRHLRVFLVAAIIDT
jgi:hypothetical protein